VLRKKEREKLLEEEMSTLKSAKAVGAPKVTKAQIDAEVVKERLHKEGMASPYLKYLP
jgi:hypothetical protein